MNILLGREIGLRAFDAIMEIGRAEKRQDILSVLMLAGEQGGEVSAADICKYLLMERPIGYGETVMKRCIDLGVLDPEGRLTEYGKETLEKKRLFNQERGRFRILCTEDPLFPQKILEITEQNEPDIPRGWGENRTDRRNTKLPPEEMEIPKWLFKTENTTFDILSTGTEIRVYKIEPLGLPGNPVSTERLEVHWELPVKGEPTLKVTGYAQRTLQAPPVQYWEIFRQIMKDEYHRWEEDSQTLKCDFQTLSEAERMTFRKNVLIESPSMGGLGEFNNTIIHDVPIVPATGKDAQEWADWLLTRSITRYSGRKAYRELITNIGIRFPNFEVKLPSLEKVAEQERKVSVESQGRPSREYWYLQAPMDLQMPEESK